MKQETKVDLAAWLLIPAKFVTVDFMQVKRLSLKSETFTSAKDEKWPLLRQYLGFFNNIVFELQITPNINAKS